MPSRPDPIVIEPPIPSGQPATIIFLHGFDDDGQGWTGLSSQFNAAKRLQHVKWILPTAPHNFDARANAWYLPRALTGIPTPKRQGHEDSDDDDDAEGLENSMEYICGLIDVEVEKGTPAPRIVLGGFSQGCALSLLVALRSRWRGKLGGVVGLSGYLPLYNKFKKMDDGAAEKGEVATRFFIAHGTGDQLIPMKVFANMMEMVERVVSGGRERVVVKVYQGMGHSTSGAEVGALCEWLEEVLPS